MQVILFDTNDRNTLYPFTAIRPVAAIRTGILTAIERVEKVFGEEAGYLCPSYLQTKYPFKEAPAYLYIDAKLILSNNLLNALKSLSLAQGLIYQGRIIAVRTSKKLDFGFTIEDCTELNWIEWTNPINLLEYPFQITQWNASTISEDYLTKTAGRRSAPLSTTNQVIGAEHIFIEEGAIVEHCILNASAGPIYIGNNSLVMEGAMIRGPFAALEQSVVKMGAKIYGATTVGQKCTVGGEIKNTVFFDYSNKAHDGYLGDAVIGTWCNIGAGASCSNIKNTAGEVKIWNQPLHQWISAGNKCGVLLGDYTRVAINSSLTTGLVSGVCSNILTAGLSAKYIADFTWNIHTGEKYHFEKAARDIDNWMQLKQQEFSAADRTILQHIYTQQP